MSFLYNILSLEKRIKNKFNFDKEPSILIEVLFRHENRIENKLGNEYLVLYSP